MYDPAKEIPADDVAILERTYRASDGYSHAPTYKAPLQPRDAKDFAGDVNSRIYTEWCMEGYPGSKGKQGERYREYRELNVFGAWIACETHFALERLMESDAVEQITHDTYQQVRTQVVEAAGHRAIDIFREWKGPYSPEDKGDTRNLRASLQPYLEQRQEQKAA